MNETMTILSERVDDIPLLLAQMARLGVQPLLDRHFPTHGNWQGLSLGWVTVIWLAHRCRTPFVVRQDIWGPQPMERRIEQEPQEDTFRRRLRRPITAGEKHRENDLCINHDTEDLPCRGLTRLLCHGMEVSGGVGGAG